MNIQWAKEALEAMLFAVGEPVSATQLAQAMELEPAEVSGLLADIKQEYEDAHHGFFLMQLADRWQFVTKNEYAEPVRNLLDTRRNMPLSNAALEVLAIVAYNQPVSRAFIDQVRGVDSASSVQTLVSRGLIEEAGRLDLPGHPVSFVTTDHFLRCFDMTGLDQLPPLHTEDTLNGELPLLEDAQQPERLQTEMERIAEE